MQRKEGHFIIENILKFASPEMDTEEEKYQEFILDNPHFLNHISLYRQCTSNVKLALQWIHCQNNINAHHGRKMYLIVPIYSMIAKYITIDTDSLYEIINSKKKIDMNKKEFGQKIYIFQEYFKVPKRFFNDGVDQTVFNLYDYNCWCRCQCLTW